MKETCLNRKDEKVIFDIQKHIMESGDEDYICDCAFQFFESISIRYHKMFAHYGMKYSRYYEMIKYCDVKNEQQLENISWILGEVAYSLKNILNAIPEVPVNQTGFFKVLSRLREESFVSSETFILKDIGYNSSVMCKKIDDKQTIEIYFDDLETWIFRKLKFFDKFFHIGDCLWQI